ncbi:MAG TPA: hemerythrin domain-containing protein [Candidatus Acidoferrales bacterium]|jgi:iron-sulfur cluster repair protein YtfE (RIC family)|nr:hemerythrin domain-containing protein [Candidatus Acidoferrales bacterium]
MAALNQVFQSESERIHSDHQEMLAELAELELALEHIDSPAADASDSIRVLKVKSLGQKLARQLPEHCMREEVKLFETIAEVSGELAEFVRIMKREHVDLFVQLNAFCVGLDELPNAVDLDEAVAQLKQQGFDVSRALRQHITTEEHELQGFL